MTLRSGWTISSVPRKSADFKDDIPRLAMENEWLLEEGWGLFLVCWLLPLLGYDFSFSEKQGSHYLRCGIVGLGQELQRRGIARQAQWGARGIV
jgi:hypothetical protein